MYRGTKLFMTRATSNMSSELGRGQVGLRTQDPWYQIVCLEEIFPTLYDSGHFGYGFGTWPCPGRAQDPRSMCVGYQNTQLDVLNPTMYHTCGWEVIFIETPIGVILTLSNFEIILCLPL